MSRNTDTKQRPPGLDRLPTGSLRVLQLTDPHLYASRNGQLMGVNTWESFTQVLRLARAALDPIDLALATGDLVHDASPEGYAELRRLLSELAVPVHCLPGNHDAAEVMARHLTGDQVGMPFAAVHGGWLLVQLDSTIAGRVEGELSAETLERLETTLAEHPDKHALISLHHHPVAIGSNWLDAMGLTNRGALFELLGRYPGVRAIVCGHIHQGFEQRHRRIRILGTPSTCFQFTPQSPRFSLDHKPPGCRWLALLPDGKIDTGTLFLDGVPDSLSPSAGGY